MNRRDALKSLLAVVGGFTLDPELALWRPGARTFFDIHRAEPAGIAFARYAMGQSALRSPIDISLASDFIEYLRPRTIVFKPTGELLKFHILPA